MWRRFWDYWRQKLPHDAQPPKWNAGMSTEKYLAAMAAGQREVDTDTCLWCQGAKVFLLNYRDDIAEVKVCPSCDAPLGGDES